MSKELYPATAKFTEEKGCHFRSESIIEGNESGTTNERHIAELTNSKGKRLEYASSKVSLDKAKKLLEEKVENRIREENMARKPFEELKFKVNQITDLNFYNKDNVDPLSNGATYRGWDLKRYEGYEGVVNIHNAANNVIWFDMLNERHDINLNLYCVNFWREEESKELFKVMQAIEEYYDVDLAIRKAEFGVTDNE